MAIPSTYHGPVHSMDSARAPGLEGEAKITAHRGGGAALNMVPILLHALRTTPCCSGALRCLCPGIFTLNRSEAVLKHPRQISYLQIRLIVLSSSPHTQSSPSGAQWLPNHLLIATQCLETKPLWLMYIYKRYNYPQSVVVSDGYLLWFCRMFLTHCYIFPFFL